MDLRTHIQTLFKEAEIYRQQGLFPEAKQKYKDAIVIVEKENVKNKARYMTP